MNLFPILFLFCVGILIYRFISRMTEKENPSGDISAKDDINESLDVKTFPDSVPESFPLSDFSETESESFSEIVPIFDSEPTIHVEPSVVIPEPSVLIPEPSVVIPEPEPVPTPEYIEIEINESMTVKELRSIADELGIKIPKSISKKKILELLNT